jgi:mannosyltransferase OCH1-like enzyme
MKKRRSIVLLSVCVLIALTISLVSGCSKKDDRNLFFSAIKEVDFDVSMGKGTNEFRFVFANGDDVQRYNVFKELYEKNLPSKVQAAETPKIPKIIHQIWLGPKTPPPYFSVFRDKWKSLHPDWEYRLWTDADLDDLTLELRDIIEASPNFAEKSDVLRAELLERFGGVYMDVDMDCNHSIDDLAYKYDFFAGVEYPHKIATTTNRVWMGISLIAVKPHHPIFKRWKELIRARWESVNNTYSSPIEKVINHTYFPFTLAVLEKCHEENLINMTFPATYFYPLSAANAAKRRSEVRGFREKFYELLETLNLKKPRAFSRAYPETLAVHYWGNSWIGTSADQVKDLQQQVDLLKKDLYRLSQKMKLLEQGKIITDSKDAKQAAPKPAGKTG